jgi:hypothetical protein
LIHASGDQISIQEAKIYLHFYLHSSTHPGVWFTNREVAAVTKLNEHTTRVHTKVFFEHGFLDRVHAHPGYRYRYKAGGDSNNHEVRLLEAVEAFGLGLASGGQAE